MDPITQLVTQVGVGGILAVLILREVFGFLSKKKSKNNSCSTVPTEKFQSAMRKIDDLHKWHDQRDTDGVPIWYVRRSLEDAMNKLSESIDNQTTVMQSLVTCVHDVSKDVSDLKSTVVPK